MQELRKQLLEREEELETLSKTLQQVQLSKPPAKGL